MSPVVTYCRVSSEEQAQKDLSIPAQRKLLRRWVDENAEHDIVAEFVDEGQSAYAPADKRPGFCEMVRYCRKHQVEAVLVHKLDRFSRNREESILFKSLLRSHGVAVRSITEHFDPETPQGFLYEGMIEVINQFYSMNLATETLKGMRENAERGYVNGGRVAFGYRLEKVGDGRGREHGRLVLGPEREVALVKEIFEMAANQGLGLKAIANELNRRKEAPPQGRHWSGSSINNILNNETYLGHLIWNKTRKNGRSGRKATAPEDRIITRDAHPAIVDQALFERRKEIAASRDFGAHHSRSKHAKWLLARLIVCDHCGANFGGRKYYTYSKKSGRQTRYAYYCAGYMNKGNAVCTALPIARDWIEGTVLKIIRARICEPDGLAEIERLVRSRIDAQRQALGASSRVVDAKLSDIDRQIQNLVRAIGQGVAPDLCQAQIDELQGRREAVEREARLLRREDHYQQAIERNLKELSRLSELLGERFDTLHPAHQREIVLHFVEKIEVRERRYLDIFFKIPFDPAGVKSLADEVRWPVEGETGEGESDGSEARRTGTDVQSSAVRGAISYGREKSRHCGFSLFVFRGLPRAAPHSDPQRRPPRP
jgi:site-specific DNA recombinase